MEVPVLPHTAAEHFMHKNRLQEHAQRASIPLPVYTTVNEGSPHAPEFRASVVIDGARFTSRSTFNNRKAAEQEVARVAFEELSRMINPATIPLIHNDLSYCKSILHEYCAKKKLERPTYNTCAVAGSPVFSCAVVFCGIKYTESLGRSKREAEQMAARAVIESVLGNFEARNCMYQIIKSKCRLIAAIHSISGSHLVQRQSMISKMDEDDLSTTNVVEKKEEAIVLTNDKLPASIYPGQPAIAVPVESRFSEVKILQHECVPEHLSTSLCIGQSIPRLSQSNLPVVVNVERNFGQCSLPHDNKLLGTHNLVGNSNPGQPAMAAAITSCSAEGTCTGGDAPPVALSVVPRILDDSTLGKRKKRNKKKKNKSPSKKIKNEGLPPGVVAHPLAHEAPVHGCG